MRVLVSRCGCSDQVGRGRRRAAGFVGVRVFNGPEWRVACSFRIHIDSVYAVSREDHGTKDERRLVAAYDFSRDACCLARRLASDGSMPVGPKGWLTGV